MSAYRILAETVLGKRQLGRPTKSWEDDSEIALSEIRPGFGN